MLPVDALKFKDSKKYTERLKDALEATGETDALIVMGGAVHAVPIVAACFEFEFMGGSMGSVVGERFVRGVEAAIEQKTPFVSFTATGGARMQEGLLSLLQMAKTNAALTNGVFCSIAASTPRTKRSPTTEPIEPPMKSNSKQATTTGTVMMAPPITTIASVSPVTSTPALSRSAYFLLSLNLRVSTGSNSWPIS